MSHFLFILMLVESNFEPSAVGDSGLAVGVLQIHPVVIKDVNRIYGTTYTIQDRFDPFVSFEIAEKYLSHWEPNGSYEEMARCWNGGPSWRAKRANTDRYWNKVKELL